MSLSDIGDNYICVYIFVVEGTITLAVRNSEVDSDKYDIMRIITIFVAR